MWLEKWLQEVRRNSRLRYGIWTVLAILAVNLLLGQQDRLNLAIEDKRRVEAQFLRTRHAANVDWQSRLAAEQQLAARMEPFLWHAESTGVAQASLQKSITGILDTVEVLNYRVRVTGVRPVRNVPGLWRMDLSVGGRFKRSRASRLITLLEEMEKKVVVQSFSVSAARVSILVSAYVVGLDEAARPVS